MVPRAPAGRPLTRSARVPFLDLPAEYLALRPAVDAAIRRVLRSGRFILGPEHEAFEAEAARYFSARHALGVASGTDALELALRACGIGPGDEVITTAFSFFATAEAIVTVGACPVFVDIDPESFNLDPALLPQALTRRTRAILPVHLYGQPADMKAILAFARRHRLRVIEDCAQAAGASIGSRSVGTFGDAGCLSFYPTKNLGAYGDGGMVLTDDTALARRIRLLRAHGEDRKYHHVLIGRTSRLDELQAAILRVKLRRLTAWTAARRRMAAAYRHALAGLDLRMPQERRGARHAYHLFTVRTRRRAALQRALAAAGIATAVHYPSTLPAQPALRSVRGRWPNAAAAAREVLSLPLYPTMPRAAVARVAAALRRAV